MAARSASIAGKNLLKIGSRFAVLADLFIEGAGEGT
jgi:hypothetical protein